MADLSSTNIFGELKVSGKTLLNNELEVAGSSRISDDAGGNVSLELWRGTNASWKLLNTSGTLKIQSNYTSSVGNYFDVATIAYNTGNIWTKGNVVINENLTVGGTRVPKIFVQSSTPSGATTGDIWIVT